MGKYKTDPLLALGTMIVLVGQAIMAIAALALIVAIPAVALLQDLINTEIRAEMADPAFLFPLPEVLGIMAMVLLIAGLLFFFLAKLRRIIATVGEGDPFMPVNAARLTAMAWLMLAVELITWPMAALANYLGAQFDPGQVNIEAEYSFDFSGIVMVITLFILARVFRKGTEMREELEGTV